MPFFIRRREMITMVFPVNLLVDCGVGRCFGGRFGHSLIFSVEGFRPLKPL